MMKIIFKHSHLCPISRAAKREMDALLENNEQAFEYEFVNVVENRERSNEIEQKYGIPHQSPQVIILDENDKVLWHESHRAINANTIREAINI
jgi:bacillithiol system protein YtxJ